MHGLTPDEWKEVVMDAIEIHSYDELDQLLQRLKRRRMSLNFKYRTGVFTPLILAVYCGRRDIVKGVLKYGADVNFANDHGITPLIQAAKYCAIDIVELLLNNNAYVHEVDCVNYWTALHYAVWTNKHQTVHLLITHNAKFYDPTMPLHRSPIWTAAVHDRSDILKYFFEMLKSSKQVCNMFSTHEYDMLFNGAVKSGSELSAITILHNGYFPIQETGHELQPFSSCFHLAADFGMYVLMGLMVELNPQYLQEEWLVQSQISDRLILHPDFVSWLVQYRRQPSCLAKLCKSKILCLLGIHYNEKVHFLPLPNSLKTFLKDIKSAREL